MRTTIIFIMAFVFIASCSHPKQEKQIIHSDKAPKAIGPYSQAVQWGNTLYLSGQLGIDPETGKLVEGFKAQAHQALTNQFSIIEEAGFSKENIVQCQVFLLDMEQYPVFNEIYKQYIKSDFPARAVLEVSEIPAGGLVEIMMIVKK